MTRRKDSNAVEAAMELLCEAGFEGFAEVMRILLNESMNMKAECSAVLGADLHERTPQRSGCANGYKPKTLATRMGKITLDVPQVRDSVEFYPWALEKGLTGERALKLAAARTYVQGVSTRKVAKVMQKLSARMCRAPRRTARRHHDLRRCR